MSFLITKNKIISFKDFKKISNKINNGDLNLIDNLINQHDAVIKSFLSKHKFKFDFNILFNKSKKNNKSNLIICNRLKVLLHYLENEDFLKLYNLIINKYKNFKKNKIKNFNNLFGFTYLRQQLSISFCELIYNKMLSFLINNKINLFLETLKLNFALSKNIKLNIKNNYIINNNWSYIYLLKNLKKHNIIIYQYLIKLNNIIIINKLFVLKIIKINNSTIKSLLNNKTLFKKIYKKNKNIQEYVNKNITKYIEYLYCDELKFLIPKDLFENKNYFILTLNKNLIKSNINKEDKLDWTFIYKNIKCKIKFIKILLFYLNLLDNKDKIEFINLIVHFTTSSFPIISFNNTMWGLILDFCDTNNINIDIYSLIKYYLKKKSNYSLTIFLIKRHKNKIKFDNEVYTFFLTLLDKLSIVGIYSYNSYLYVNKLLTFLIKIDKIESPNKIQCLEMYKKIQSLNILNHINVNSNDEEFIENEDIWYKKITFQLINKFLIKLNFIFILSNVFFNEIDNDDIGKTCPICFDEENKINKENGCKLKCNHVYHINCLKTFIKLKNNNVDIVNYKLNCPYCRTKII